MHTNDFDWEWSESIAIPTVRGIAVYQNSGGDIVIRQQNLDSDEDSVIWIPIDQLSALIAALQEELA